MMDTICLSAVGPVDVAPHQPQVHVMPALGSFKLVSDPPSSGSGGRPHQTQGHELGWKQRPERAAAWEPQYSHTTASSAPSPELIS